MNFKEELEQRTREAEEIIKRYLPKEEGFAKNMAEAMNYSMLSGGKRLRPVFMRVVYSMFGGTGKVIEPFMAAMEMVHTHSLIHDDLPALDNDEYRRGRKTTHAVYGEPAAILAGDALLNYAFETATLAFEIEPGNPAVGCALRKLAVKSGIYGMVGGQVVDVESEKKPDETITREKLNFIYHLKTGALMEAAMSVGAILAGASEEETARLEEVAARVGLAFQIQDDILDVTSTLEVLGKPIGSDEKNNKATYVTFEGIEKSKEDVKKLSEEAVEALSSFQKKDEFLQELFIYLIQRNK